MVWSWSTIAEIIDMIFYGMILINNCWCIALENNILIMVDKIYYLIRNIYLIFFNKDFTWYLPWFFGKQLQNLSRQCSLAQKMEVAIEKSSSAQNMEVIVKRVSNQAKISILAVGCWYCQHFKDNELTLESRVCVTASF